MVIFEFRGVIGDDAAGVDDDALHAGFAPMVPPPGGVIAFGIALHQIGLPPAQRRLVPRLCAHRPSPSNQAFRRAELAQSPSATMAKRPDFRDVEGKAPIPSQSSAMWKSPATELYRRDGSATVACHVAHLPASGAGRHRIGREETMPFTRRRFLTTGAAITAGMTMSALVGGRAFAQGADTIKFAASARGLRTIDPQKSIQGVDNWAIIAIYDKL